MPASYYFWRWADNDLPGPPGKVHAALLRGELHPALQVFDARPLLRKLESAATGSRKRGEEWHWEMNPADAPERARFVFLCCPPIEKYNPKHFRLTERLIAFGVSGYDEDRMRLIEFLLPKINGLELGQYPDDEFNDIAADDLPALLKRIDPQEPDATATLTDWRNHWVQCSAYQRRYTIEWRENHDIRDAKKFDQWRAGYPADIAARQRGNFRRKFIPAGLETPRWIGGNWRVERAGHKDHELLCYGDMLRIFEAFLRGERPPAHYRWRNINHLVQ